MIYLLEDDESIRELICYTLSKSGMEIRGFGLPSKFSSAMGIQLPELIILDIMLPEEDGISVLERLRANPDTENIPIIMLTAKDSEYDKVEALDKGADDYVTKPFGIMELTARVKALLRRSARSERDTEKIYEADGLTVSTGSHEAEYCGEKIFLTYKEFELLCFLFENRGAVVTRNRILREIWGYEFDGENRTVDVHIRTMRRKLGAAADIVETVRGVGYKIAAEK